MSQVWRSGCYDGGTLLVLQAMADWADDEGNRIFPKVVTLAKKARLSERATQYALARLIKDGVLIIVAKAQGHRPTEYRIDVEALDRVQRAAAAMDVPQDTDASGTEQTGVQNLRPANAAPLGVQSATSEVQPTAPPIDNHQTQPLEETPIAGAREGSPEGKARKPVPYPSDFERFWTECRKWPGFSPNMSKPEALKAWQQTKDARPGTGDMVDTSRAYSRWLEQQNAERAKRRDTPHPTLHPATWLRQRRWTGFLEQAALEAAAGDTDRMPRRVTLSAEYVEALRNAGLSEVIVATWFADGEFCNGTFLTTTPFKAKWLQQHYERELQKAFGAHVTVGVKRESEADAA